jgi:hypothetical protein
MIRTSALGKRAASGDPDAQFRLGYRLALGRARPKRWRSAASWWARAAPSFTLVPAMTLGMVWQEMSRVRCDAMRMQRVKVMPRLNTISALVIVTDTVCRKMPDAPSSGFARPLNKAMLTPSGTLAFVFTRVWGSVAMTEPRCVVTWARHVAMIRRPCSTWASVIGTDMGSRPMWSRQPTGFAWLRSLGTEVLGWRSEHLSLARRDERANNRLKLTARGRCRAAAARRSRAAA